MKPKEAIIQLMCAGGQDQLVVDALDLAIEALEKQVTNKPLSENKYYFTGKCPSCGAVFLDNTTKYCGNCGQALDWDNEAEQ